MQQKILEYLIEIIENTFIPLGLKVNENHSFSGDLNLDELDLVDVVMSIEMELDVCFDIEDIDSDLYYGTLTELSEFLANHIE